MGARLLQPLVRQGDAGFCQAHLGRGRQQAEQIQGKLGAGFVPVLVDQIAVIAALGAVIEGQAREQFEQGPPGFLAGDAAL